MPSAATGIPVILCSRQNMTQKATVHPLPQHMQSMCEYPYLVKPGFLRNISLVLEAVALAMTFSFRKARVTGPTRPWFYAAATYPAFLAGSISSYRPSSSATRAFKLLNLFQIHSAIPSNLVMPHDSSSAIASASFFLEMAGPPPAATRTPSKLTLRELLTKRENQIPVQQATPDQQAPPIAKRFSALERSFLM